MNANCKAPFSDKLFEVIVKERNKYFPRNFILRLIFNDGIVKYNLFRKDW
jgi:hypothetical protein